MGGHLPDYADEFFDFTDPAGPPTGIITDYYYQMSFGQFVVVGDYYGQTITMVPSVDTDGTCSIALPQISSMLLMS